MTAAEKDLLTKAVAYINTSVDRPVRIMEVCGTHTRSIAQYGIKSLLHPNIGLISGPGCPVCVTEQGYIDALIALSEQENSILATFGDLFRLPGSTATLQQKKTQGRQIVPIYSPEDALRLARQNRNCNVIFAAVGFETTAPLFAAVVLAAKKEELYNLTLLCSLKRMPPVIGHLMEQSSLAIDGMLCPGHVASIIGAKAFLPIVTRNRIPAVIAGFSQEQILSGIAVLCSQISGKRPVELVNLYKSCVDEEQSARAANLVEEVFTQAEGNWRGIGKLAGSALVLKKTYEQFDASKQFADIITPYLSQTANECSCQQVLTGQYSPVQCLYFGKECTPATPLGPCMVSPEGACAIDYQYGGTFA